MEYFVARHERSMATFVQTAEEERGRVIEEMRRNAEEIEVRMEKKAGAFEDEQRAAMSKMEADLRKEFAAKYEELAELT